MANSWGASGTTWGIGDWGDQTTTTVVISSGFSITATLDDVSAFPEQGWGGDAWGDEDWGGAGTTVFPTGFLTTASLGTLAYAQSESGWGRDEWGIGNWGENTTTVVLTTGLEMTGHQGPDAWGQAPWNEQISWGGGLTCDTTQLSVEVLTGIQGTLSLGTPAISRLDMIFDLTTSLQMSAGLGVPNINNGADHSQGVGSLLATASLGTVTEEVVTFPTGYSATMSLGTVSISSNPIIVITATNLVTGSLGSVTITDMSIGVSGYSVTGSLGTTTVTDMQVGISGLEISGTLGSGGVSPLHYKDVDITGNTSYTNKNVTGNTSYTYVEHSA